MLEMTGSRAGKSRARYTPLKAEYSNVRQGSEGMAALRCLHLGPVALTQRLLPLSSAAGLQILQLARTTVASSGQPTCPAGTSDV
jgi:hypothetical protein